jgi:hypothetical protein
MRIDQGHFTNRCHEWTLLPVCAPNLPGPSDYMVSGDGYYGLNDIYLLDAGEL